MAAAFPKQIIVSTTGRPAEGVAIHLRFEMSHKNSFNYMAFLDRHGKVEISGEELLKAFDEERNTFIMDYVDPRIGFTGKIALQVFGIPELQSALEAFKMFNGKLSFPEHYEHRLKAAIDRGQDPDRYQLTLEVIN